MGSYWFYSFIVWIRDSFSHQINPHCVPGALLEQRAEAQASCPLELWPGGQAPRLIEKPPKIFHSIRQTVSLVVETHRGLLRCSQTGPRLWPCLRVSSWAPPPTLSPGPCIPPPDSQPPPPPPLACRVLFHLLAHQSSQPCAGTGTGTPLCRWGN